MLSITNFEKRYNETLILRIDNVELRHGIYWIKGENGSGKSTLFKSIAGLIPFDGKVILDDINLTDQPVAFRSLVNFSEAEPIYPGFLTAKDLVRFVGTTKGASKENMQAIIKHFGVDIFYEKACETFSSGMLKKVSLALAFLGSPKLIILDEPLITLDERTRSALVELIKRYLAEGVTFLISSHQMIDNLPISDTFEIKQKAIYRCQP